MKKKSNTSDALAILDAEIAKAATADADLEKEAKQEEALQAAGDASREFFRKARRLEAGGKADLAKVMQRKAKFIFAKTLRMKCAELGVEVPGRD